MLRRRPSRCRPSTAPASSRPPPPIPARVKSFEIPADFFQPSPLDAVIAEAMEKLRLEDERMRRILPDLPLGYSWRGEIQSEHELDFAHDRGDVTVRLAYRLRPVGE